jgi:hypothetical protein
VDSLKGIQTRLPELVTQTMADPDLFRDLYRFTFKVRISPIFLIVGKKIIFNL